MTRRAFAWIFCSLALFSCDSAEPGEDAGGSSLADREREVLGSLADGVFLPVYRAFAQAAAELEAATAAYAEGGTDAERDAARAAWVTTMDRWQEAEVFVFGPAGPPPGVTADFVGEMMLRDEIYAFPFTSTCRIDQETLEESYADVDAFAAENVNVRGLGALEYVLYAQSTDNTCSALSPINADGTWAALGADEVVRRRARYAHAAAVLVSRAAVRLRDAWEPSGGDFAGALRRAGLSGSPFSTAHAALTQLAGSMLYLDTFTKDMKIAEPAGILVCTTGSCLDQLESRLSARSKEHVLTNLRAFRRVFLGAEPGEDGLGFDDLLIEVGAGELSGRLEGALGDAIAAVEALDGTLEEAIAADPEGVRAAFDALTIAARLFKIDLFSALDIDTAGLVPGDND